MRERFVRSALPLILCALSSYGQRPAPDSLLRSGPMLGYSEMTETSIWLQTTRPVDVQIRFWKDGEEKRARLTEVVRTTKENDLIARFIVPRLQFGTHYEYEVYIDETRIDLPYATKFQTQTMWQWRTDPPPFRMAVGSCAYANDTPFDRPGNPYGSDMRIFKTIAGQSPDLMLWLGDNVYLREGDWGSESGIRYRYAHTRALPELQELLASTHHYAMWDDHDFGPNNSDRTYPLREVSLEVFRDYWSNRGYGTQETAGTFSKFTWADVDFFMLDGRYHRSPNRTPATSPEKVMFGPAQMQWLLDSLRASQAPFKVVAAGSQILNATGTAERLTNFPVEYDKLLSVIREEKIGGVVFLSGDRHHTELLKVDGGGGYPLYELTISPLTAGLSVAKAELNNPLRVQGTLINDVHTFALLDVSGPRNGRALSITVLDTDGRLRWKRKITEMELKSAVP